MNPHKLLGKLIADEDQTFKLVSPTFDHEGRLPRKYTNGGQGALKDLSPPLEWYNVPDGTKSLALVVEDAEVTSEPDGPAVPWTHWVVMNIPPSVKRLPEGLSNKECLGQEYGQIKEGNNDWKVPGWCGPVQQSGNHRIVFRLYALDDEMHLGNKVTKDKLVEAIEGHVLAEAELMALF
ncbi:Phosphatidylethanolamine-binding protein [Carex littledalei]|uniref:Phosphatidylethanolamine-binding protein n=1 Tax=Carex littledalei TaxID=544730 RepID=A0A833VPT6_9POAL|nr:Phosphatidylethanolamine-binding protein [Carex littledalei]